MVTVRTKVVDGSYTLYGITGTWSSTNNYNNSTPRTNINNFYAGLASTSKLRQNAVTHDAKTKLGIYGSLNAASGISVPTQTKATGTTDVAFALSFQEQASYCSKNWYSSPPASNGSPAGAVTNHNILVAKGDAGTYPYNIWNRTIGETTANASVISYSGTVNSGPLTNYYYVRPALWVKSDIIDNLP